MMADSDPLGDYREARAMEYQNRGAGAGLQAQPFELERFLSSAMNAAGTDEQKQRLAMRVCSCSTILVLLLMCIGSIEPLQYGLTVNWITRHVNQEGIYYGGRHLIGPWNSFITFPSTVVTVEFSKSNYGNGPLATRTKDGLSLTLSLAFQYRLEFEKLAELFRLANVNYEPIIIQNARDVLLKAAADYEAVQYWQQREQIGVEMRKVLDRRLATVFAKCTGLQILLIELPKEFEDSIVQTQVQQQSVKTKMNEQNALRIQADTKVLQASYTRNVTVTQNGADAAYDQETRIAEALANQRLLDIEAETLRTVKDELGLTKEQMLAYQQFYAYARLQNASFIYGLGNAMLTVPTAGA